MKLAFAIPLSALILCAASGCAAEAEDPGTTESADDELRAFQKREVVGTLAYGETKTVVHPSRPTYRAYAFEVAAGDEIELRVKAAGHDAVAWLLGADNATIARADAFHDASAEVITYKATRSEALHVAFREADYEPATFEVSLTKKNTDVMPGIPACTGTPRFPAQGSSGTHAAVRVEFRAACEGCEWYESSRKEFSYSPIRLDSTRSVTIEATIGQRTIDDPTAEYLCTTIDTGSATIGADGKGKSSMHTIERCRIRGGDGGPVEEGGFRRGDATVGAGCVTVVDQSLTKRVVYYAKF